MSGTARQTLRAAIVQAALQLKQAGVETPETDARLLMQHAAQMSHAQVVMQGDTTLDANTQARFAQAIARRALREPVSRIIGKRGFWKADFFLSPETLDPRPDSETLIEAALKYQATAPARVLDLGTGTGCLLLSLLQEWPRAQGAGLDISADAIAVANKNARALGVSDRAHFSACDWKDYAPPALCDALVSNPPYIAPEEMETLEPEVALYDPLTALLGGHDGLEAYRSIIALMPRWLKKGGLAFFEIGRTQAGPVRELLARRGCAVLETVPDLAGHDRVIVAKMP